MKDEGNNLDPSFMLHHSTFNLIADAPGGVPKLRELILQLAIRGKLVPQDPKDESAGKDLKEIVKPSIIPYAIPRGWRWTTLRSISRDLGQKVPDKRFTYIDVSAIDKDRGRIGEDPQILNANDAPSRARKIVHAGTVIYSTIRPYLLNIAVVDREFDPDPIVSTAFFVMHPFACVANRYLFYYLRGQPFTEYVRNAMTGMAYPAVNDSTMSVAPFPLPPLPEQKRIVAKVDELMKRCDELETRQKDRAARHKTLVTSCLNAVTDPKNSDLITHNASFNLLFSSPESITELRKTILQLAVQGRLVSQDPRDEPTALTLAAAGVDKCHLVTSSEDDQGSIPNSWARVRFLGVGEQRLGKMLDKAKNQGEMRPYLRNTNVQWMRFELGDVKEMRLTEGEQAELRLKVGDLLVCEGGEPGRCAIWNEEIREMYFQKAIHRIRPCSAIRSEYIALNLRADSQNGRLAAYFTGATIKHFTGRSLGQYMIPVPPFAEQKRIVAKVNELMALCDQLEAKLIHSSAETEKLAGAVVNHMSL